jgi:TATA-box binding protein (TBP) (component of TFIID and TFIIIB)
MNEIDSDWKLFCEDELVEHSFIKPLENNGIIPESNKLYISTQTIISYLNTDVNLKEVFWKLPIIPYYLNKEGIVKKQIKFNSSTKEELEYINTNLKTYDYVSEYVINHIDNPTGRIKFKDVRKISIGISKKDITSYRCKRKSAFYNCFVVILRLLHNDLYKEVHVKIFNTGKLEIPGIQNSEILHKVYTLLIEMIKPYINTTIKMSFILSKSQTVLINSNFNCGYYLKRDVLNELFKSKYNDYIRSIYDPCTYPGIQCEIYYNEDIVTKENVNALTITDMKATKNITKVSFMIFRTGSVLIVGKCSEDILYNIYEYLCSIFVKEYNHIHETNSAKLLNTVIKKTRNSRVKSITVNI